MVARSRNRYFPKPKGQWGYANTSSPQPGSGTLRYTDFSACDDQIGVAIGDCNPFKVEKRTTNGGIINMNYQPGTFAAWFKDYACDLFDNSAEGYHLSVAGVPSDVEAATMAAARTNPSRPYVDVPVNILDMRHGLTDFKEVFVRRLSRRADLLRSRVNLISDTWLQNEFLIRPMVSDIVKLVYVQDQINRRIEDINRLYNGKGLRKTVLIGTYEAFQPQVLKYLQSAGVTIYNYFDVRTYVELKVHTRWYPQTMFAVAPMPDEIRRQAVRAVQGLTIDISTMWEIMPWSWFVDWFSNISEFLIAHRNIVPATLSGVYPMRHTKTYWECPGFDYRPAWASCTPVQMVRETKSRTTSFVAPYADLGFLNGNQVGILSAIMARR